MANQVAYGLNLVPETLLGHREIVVPPDWEAMLEKNFPRFDPAKHNTRITIAPLLSTCMASLESCPYIQNVSGSYEHVRFDTTSPKMI